MSTCRLRPTPRSTLAALGRAALGTVLALAACGDDPEPADHDTPDVPDAIDTTDTTDAIDTDTAPDTSPEPTARIRFALPDAGLPAPLAIPFPSDLYREGADFTGPVTDTLLDWDLAGITQQVEVLRDAYAGLDGFGHTSGALFRIDFTSTGATLDASTLPKTGADCLAATSPVAIVDVTDAGAPHRLPCIAGYFAPLQVLVVAPEAEPLRSGRRYAVLVSNRLETSDQGHLGAAPGFTALVAAPRTTARATLFGTALDRATATLGWSPDEVAGLAVYSAHTEHRKLKTVRDALVRGDYGPAPDLLTASADTAPFPTLRFCAEAKAGCTATLDAWLGTARKDGTGKDLPGAPGEVGHPEPADTGWPHDALGVVLQGAFEAPELRRPWANTSAPDDGTFDFVDGQAKAQPGVVKVPVTLILPRTAPPATGYPVVIFSHGTPSNRQFVMTFANELARVGIATVAMDGLYHGVRASGGTDARNNFPGTYVGPDGFSDASDTPTSTVELSATLQSAPRYRANLWQYALEWCQLRRLLANPTLDLSAAADQFPEGTALRFDATRIGWVGTSFGAFTGAALLPVETDIRAFFLNVGNGDALQWQGESPSNRPQIELVLLLFGMDSSVPLTRFTPFTNIAFGAIEPGFAGASTEDVDPAGPDILMTEVEYDEYVPNRSTEILAAALGIPQITPAARNVPILATAVSPLTATPGHPARGLVHMGSASHSSNLGRRWGQRSYAFPVALEDGVLADFPPLAPPVWVQQPVVATQAMMVRFMTSAFAGQAVIDAGAIPRVIDFDGDGYCDLTEQASGSDWHDPAAHPAGTPDCTWVTGF